jgi:arylsulfatase A-like enzyme
MGISKGSFGLFLRNLIVAVVGILFLSCRAPDSNSNDETGVNDGLPTIQNMILISVDTLRADHMSLYGYGRETTPEIDAFFADGTVYERAYATTSRTPPSVVSFLSGLLPHHHGVRQFNAAVPEELNTLPKLLGGAGYQTAAVVSNQVLSADWTELDTHFDYYDDEVTEKEVNRDQYERSAGPTTDAAITWLESDRDPKQPFFLWVHYMDPHGPYTPPTPKVREFTHSNPVEIDPARVPKYQRFSDVVDGREYVDRYDEEIAYLDQQTGRLLEALESVMADGETLIAFTADHGETLMDHEQWFRHDYHVYEELVRVPLLVRGPGFKKVRRAKRVSNMDIVPTTLELARLTVPGNLDGVSLLRLQPDRHIFVESGVSKTMWTGVIADSGKWLNVREMKAGGRTAFFHFNLSRDPREKKPVQWDPARTTDPAPRALFSLYESKPVVESGIAADLSPEEAAEKEEQLRSLGYID